MKKNITVGIIVILVALVTFLVWQLYVVQSDVKHQSAEDLSQEVITQLSNRMRLPENEEPVVAQIDEAERLAGEQDFFAGAQNGDYLILYPQAKKAVVYRYEDDYILNAGPTYFQEQDGELAPE